MSFLPSSTKKTYNSTTNTTNTPIVPEWASNLTQGSAAKVGEVLGLDSRSLVAPANNLHWQGAAEATNLNGQAWNFDGAADLTRGAANTSWLNPYMTAETPFASGGKAYDYVDRYVNPYLRDVVDSSAADLDANAGEVRAQQALDLAGAGAFGGSGAALTQSMTEGELARARASTLSGLRSHAYDAALGAAAGDAGRATQARIANAQTSLQDRAQKVGFGFQGQQQQLTAGRQLADLASGYEANQRANVATKVQAGDTLREIDQQERQAPISHAQQVVAMLSGLPISLFTGQQTTQTTSGTEKTKDSLGKTLMQGAQTAAQLLAAGG